MKSWNTLTVLQNLKEFEEKIEEFRKKLDIIRGKQHLILTKIRKFILIATSSRYSAGRKIENNASLGCWNYAERISKTRVTVWQHYRRDNRQLPRWLSRIGPSQKYPRQKPPNKKGSRIPGRSKRQEENVVWNLNWKLVQKIKIFSLSWNLVPKIIREMQNSMVMSTFSLFQKYPFWTNLGHKN